MNTTKYCNNNYYLELLLLQKINNLEIDNIKLKKELLRIIILSLNMKIL